MTDNNPYQAPSANLDKPAARPFELSEPRGVPVERGWGWIADGFVFFKDSPAPWIATLGLFFLLIIGLTYMATFGQFVLSVTSFVWTGGIMLGCRAQALGRPFEVRYLFAGFQKNVGRLILLSVGVSAASFVIMTVTVGPIYAELLTIQEGVEPSPELAQALSDPRVFLLRLLFALLLMTPMAMAAYFAPVLIVMNDVTLLESLRLSFLGCLRNILPFLFYGVVLLLLYILAVIPMLLGLLVLFPVMFASLFVSYRDIFVK